MSEKLTHASKVIYTAPLKALAAEKFHEWAENRFKDKVVIQLTGDTLTSQAVRKRYMEQCKTADIVLMTSELLDSLTRNHANENYSWLYDVRLVVVDESHIITSEGRGHAVETSIMRFSQINPKAKIWVLSATMPNVGEFSKWLTNLNGKPTDIINSDWRPTTLNWHFIAHSVFGSYQEIQSDKVGKAIRLVQMKPDEKFIVFVWDKNTGRMMENNLRASGVECAFHNADVDFEDRDSILKRFEDDNDPMQVIIATTTLAWGSLHEDTLVQTILGPYRYGSLEPGTKVLSYNEQDFCWEFDEVLSRDLCEESEEIVIELEDGRQLIAGPSHPIYVQLPDGSLINKRADQLVAGDDVKMS